MYISMLNISHAINIFNKCTSTNFTHWDWHTVGKFCQSLRFKIICVLTCGDLVTDWSVISVLYKIVSVATASLFLNLYILTAFHVVHQQLVIWVPSWEGEKCLRALPERAMGLEGCSKNNKKSSLNETLLKILVFN